MERKRVEFHVSGVVQGVGFRPFVYRLASEYGFNGWVNNGIDGVHIQVEGPCNELEAFAVRLVEEKPLQSVIDSVISKEVPLEASVCFEIRHSEAEGEGITHILADIATCPACLNDIFNPNNRRYQYPFTNCTDCGPRYSIIEALPYDRQLTTMSVFEMCPECQAEYEDPLNRRFHAQPNACPDCGPHIYLIDSHGKSFASHHDALLQTAQFIREGNVVAIKGLGGFQLVADARNKQAVELLRVRKHRPHKPLALLFPDLETIRKHCAVSEAEANLLQSPQAPIVLLRRLSNDAVLNDNIAPQNPNIGAMLPYTPLHHLMMRELNFPIVCTSGNLSGEPICIDNEHALEKLNGIADYFLMHNRPILRPVDDSVAIVINNRPMLIRRARGYAPLPIKLRQTERSTSLIAVGAHQKNTVAVTSGEFVYVSQHIGDLDTREAINTFDQTINDLTSVYHVTPDQIIHDLHPDYKSTHFAHEHPIGSKPIQHHYAHIMSCVAEQNIELPALGFAWDGTGLGIDGTIWGSETISINDQSWSRSAHLMPFKLIGGEKAIREPRRIALALLHQIGRDDYASTVMRDEWNIFTYQELGILQQMYDRDIQCYETTSMGRLFDGIASLLGLMHTTTFEGQAAIALENLIGETKTADYYPFKVHNTFPLEKLSLVIDWQPILRSTLSDLRSQISRSLIATKFHNSLSQIILRIAQSQQYKRVILSGGCFQNRYLLENTIRLLRISGFEPYCHRDIPPNDGGIALGQILAAVKESE